MRNVSWFLPPSQVSNGSFTFSKGFHHGSLNRPTPAPPLPGHPSGLNLNFGRRSSTQAGSNVGTPQLHDLRRPSIVEMVNSGGLLITQEGEVKLAENVNAIELEQIYEEAKCRRGSCSAPYASYTSGKDLEDLGESGWMPKTSNGGSMEHIPSLYSGRCQCINTSRYWWSPKFNSEVLEDRLKKTVIEFLRRRFRVALVFISMFTLLWIVFFSVNIPFSPFSNATLSVETRNNELAIYSVTYSPGYVFGGLVLFLCTGMLLLVTFTRVYAKFARSFSILIALILMCASFALAVSQKFTKADLQGFLTLSFVAQFAITAVSILVIFTLSRLPIWLSVALAVIYLIILEGLVGFSTYSKGEAFFPRSIYIYSTLGRVALYLGMILAGITTSYLLQVRQVATFWKIAQCVLSQKALDLERDLEEKTILSMMPKPFADKLLSLQVQMAFMFKQQVVQESQDTLDPAYQSITAPFNIQRLDDVSILFADIVNFTEFSSSLSAAQLVGILNEVFSMFDDLVTKHKCEKISTLGDCYFCVSGCPEPEPKHADNCVSMGLAILEALEDYRKRTQLPVEMRVGIHTGSVFCGVMGSKRFKFDVWSRDVRMANVIESVGTPGRVLVSGATYACLSGSYVTERAPPQTTVSEPRLAKTELHYVMGLKSRPQSTGLSGLEWKKRINTIDTVCKPSELCEREEREDNKRTSPASLVRGAAQRVLASLRQRGKQSSTSTKRRLADQHSSSIMDIQSRLQRCTSYADLEVPQKGGVAGAGDEEEERRRRREDVEMDKDIVEHMEEQKVHFDTYFDPQLHLITLNFHERAWESTYRNYGRDLDDGSNGELAEMELGYRITKLSYLLDTLTLFITFLAVMVGMAVCLTSDGTFEKTWHAWLGIFLFGLLVEVTVLVLVIAVFCPRWFPRRFAKLATVVINWYVRSVVALFFIYYPLTIVGVSIAQCQGSRDAEGHLAQLAHVQMAFFVTIVVLVSSITFMEVSHIVKFVGGFLCGTFVVVMVLALNLTVCIEEIDSGASAGVGDGITTLSQEPPTFEGGTRPPVVDLPISEYFRTYYTRHVAPEAIILLLLVLVLLAVVNRMSEVSVRLSFIGRIEASARRRVTRQRKVQAEWLLFNIIPPHVAYKLRTTGKFSQDHDCVGVMFASIVNFQQYLHRDDNKGENSLRLLNVIISEFDTLLEHECFSSIDKIKTIGSTYMAASGLSLSPEESRNSVSHLLDLIEFGHHLVEVLKVMNSKMKGFVFDMQIGFNCGPVTSGVVGSRKMLYDIWGDTVNVASRMASTGAVNEIQMPQRCLERLGPHVRTHTTHKVVHIKGKGEMKTVLIRSPRTSAEKMLRNYHRGAN